MWGWAARRPTPVVLTLGIALVLAVGAYEGLSGWAEDPTGSLTLLLAVVAAAAAATLLPQIDPAYPIAIGMATTIFSGNWGNMGVPVALDRPLLLFGIAGVLVRALPDLRLARVPRVRAVHLAMVVVALYAIASAYVAGTIHAREAQFALLDRLGIIGFLLFFVAPSAFATRRQRDVLVVTLTIVGGYLGVTALFERLDLNALVFPHYINNPQLGLLPDRSRGPFLEPAANGLALFSCGVAATIGLSQWRRRLPIAVACAIVVAFCGLGIVLTLTRQIWLGSAAGTLLAILAARPLRRYFIPATVIGAVGVLAALTFIPGLQSQASSRANSKSPVWDRLNSNSAGLRMIDAKPLTGFGYYSWAAKSQPYYRQARGYPMTFVGRPHNVFLSYFIEMGLIGGTLWLVTFLWAIFTGLRRGPPELEPWRFGLFAVAVNFIVVANFTPLGYAFANHMIWLWAGICAVGLRRGDGGPAPEPVAAPRSPSLEPERPRALAGTAA